jgi:hypothetical protein
MYFSTISSTQIFHISFVHFCVIFSTEWPLDAEVPLEQCLRVYRTAFLLNRFNDAAFGKFLIPSAKFMLLTFLVNVPAFVVFCYWNRLDVTSISTLAFFFAIALPILVSCTEVTSEIYNISSQFQQNMAQKVRASENKRMTPIWIRELRSCQLVRCQIGNFYHMEGKAKLTLVNTMVNIFVFMVVQRI